MTICSNPSEASSLGKAMWELCADLFPICRSVAGAGVRETLQRLQTIVPVEVREVPSGTRVFDWIVPREWSVRDAYVKDPQGNRVIDFQQSNLHVVNGSMPVQRRMRWSELAPHLHTLPDRPAWIPYRTCFHAEDWGFCLSHETFKALEVLGDQTYDVSIDSTMESGSMSYGELYLPGRIRDEFLISTHICHPSLANDNLSGIAVATFAAQLLATRSRRHSFRFIFVPATIGAIAWLSLNEDRVHRVKHGLVLSVLGDQGPITYKRSRRGSATVDRAMECLLSQGNREYSIQEFTPLGYDQRQFCSPGFNLPVGCLMRTPNGAYDEYHTSADNLDFIRAESLEDSLAVCMSLFELLEGIETYINLNPKCEPRLGPRGLYHAFGAHTDRKGLQEAILWVLNLSDGQHDLLDICLRSRKSFALIRQAADLLFEHRLIAPQAEPIRPVFHLSPSEEAPNEHCLF